jgi:periplasmic glucans biosynthesis protein
VRELAVIAMLLLASLLLSLNPAPNPPASAKPPAAEQRQGSSNRLAPATTSTSTQPHPFGFADVRHLAQERASRDYHPVSDALPAALANLTYDQYRDIRFRTTSALWRGQSMFEVQFFHRGYRSRQRVNIFEVTSGAATAIAYNPQYFVFGKLLKPPKPDTNLGYAGFRVHYPLQTPAYKDELIAFLGASYYRVLGRGQRYGLSARGLAIDTAAQSGEEFPTFTDFWLVRPQPGDRALTIYALLDSRSVTGAYQFQVRPGGTTQVEVHCDLFARRAIGKLGVAPLTSMFLYGEDGAGHRFDDSRPQVHDSDGLMAETGHGQWIWRPLGNPRELRVNRFMDDGPRGFGLIQRERNFAHYQDNEAQYQSRPSYWVQPLGNWGSGGVELVEIPSDEEIHDNIAAYWVPARSPAAGESLSYTYLLSAFSQAPQWPPGGRVVATHTAAPVVGEDKARYGPGARRVMVQFAGGDLDGLEVGQPVRAEVSADNGKIESLTVQRIPGLNVWQVAFVVTPRVAKRPVDMKSFLSLYGEVLTETWVYQWTQ